MPFVSQKQRAWMYANHPEIARRWETETPKGEKLPAHAPKESRVGDTFHSRLLKALSRGK